MYRKIKIGVYITGVILTSFFFFRDGVNSSHTPPLGFVISLSMLIISGVWANLDYIFSHILSIYKTGYLEHTIAIIFNLILILSLIYFL